MAQPCKECKGRANNGPDPVYCFTCNPKPEASKKVSRAKASAKAEAAAPSAGDGDAGDPETAED